MYVCANAVSLCACMRYLRRKWKRERQTERQREKAREREREREGGGGNENDEMIRAQFNRGQFFYLPRLLLNVTVDCVAWLACCFRKGSRPTEKGRSAWPGPWADGPIKMSTRSSPWTSCRLGQVLGNFIFLTYLFLLQFLFAISSRYLHILLFSLLLLLLLYYHYYYYYSLSLNLLLHHDCCHRRDRGNFIDTHCAVSLYDITVYYYIHIICQIYIYLFQYLYMCIYVIFMNILVYIRA